MNAFTNWVRRAIHGPSDDETSAQSQASGRPPYPIPPTANTTPPTHTTATGRHNEATGGDDRFAVLGYQGDGNIGHLRLRPAAADLAAALQRATDTIAAARARPEDRPCICTIDTRTGRIIDREANCIRHSMYGQSAADRPSYQLRDLTPDQIAADLPRLADAVSDPPPPATPRNVGRPYPIPRLTDTTGDDMDTPRAMHEPDDESDGIRPSPHPRYGDEKRGVAYTEPSVDPVTDSGVHAAPDTDREQITVTMTVTRYTNDLLRETAAMLPADSDGRDDAIAEFYTRLLKAAPHLRTLFPDDLLTAAHGSGSAGALQRDRLLDAILGVADLYGAGPAAMERLDNVITSMGHRHAAFARADGTTQGATEQEYEVVIDVFLDLLRDALGDRFTDLHHRAWTVALNYVKIGMLWAQAHSGAAFPRAPRPAAGRQP